MTEKPKRKKKAGQRKKRTRQVDEIVHYDILVTSWDYYYGLRVSDPKSNFDHGPYSEISTIELIGEFADAVMSKFVHAVVTLSSKEGMLNENRTDHPRGIGSLSSRGEIFSAYIFVPIERFAELAGIVASGRIQSVHLLGTRLRYRSGIAINFSLNTKLEID